jgi:ankyrin repeat protein
MKPFFLTSRKRIAPPPIVRKMYKSYDIMTINERERYIRDFFFAIKVGFIDNIIYYIKFCNIDINIQDTFGWTALLIASCYEQIHVIQYLIDNCYTDINMNLQTQFGDTALIIATNRKDLQIVQYLTKNQYSRTCQANVNIQNKNGDTALHVATRIGCIEIVQYLLEQCKDTNIRIQNNSGWTPLHIACYKGQYDIIQCLTTKQSSKYSNTSTCRGSSNSKSTSMINIQNDDGYTALHYAILYGDMRIVQYLIDTCSADITITTTTTKTIATTLTATMLEESGMNIFDFIYQSKNDIHYCNDCVVYLLQVLKWNKTIN